MGSEVENVVITLPYFGCSSVTAVGEFGTVVEAGDWVAVVAGDEVVVPG
jgi:hypothetical protein